jgi:predicted NBD/HSP70 family sugar kinase
MTDQPPPALLAHGAQQLSLVTVDAYNAELRGSEGFVGDRASKRAFMAIIDDWRVRVSQAGEDPFGDTPTAEISKKQLDKVMAQGDAEAAGIIQGAIEEFSQEFSQVIRRFLRLKNWKDVQRIAVGGGLRQSRIGELAIGRTAVLLKAGGLEVDLKPIHYEPDHAGLIGSVQLLPSWILAGHDSILAVDIGGSNIRAGIVELNAKKSPDFSEATVGRFELWRHSEDNPAREDAVKRLIEMLVDLIKRAGKDDLKLAPFIGIGCPGVIRSDGTIDRGGQNLPGNWEVKSFNLPNLLRDAIPKISDHETLVVMHNDAVVQGLSEVPFMRDVQHWGVLTIGTGLGNACFTNRETAEKEPAKTEKAEKGEKAEKAEKAEKGEKAQKADKADKAEKKSSEKK